MPLLPLRPTSQFPECAVMVSFWHPGTNELLLRLPANDISSPNVFGLHYGTALLACEVLAYNARGYLSTSRDPADRGSQHVGGRDSLLLERKYHYFVHSKPQSKICRLFSEWSFPHKTYAEVWGSGISGVTMELQTDDGASLVIRERDSICAISGYSDSLSMSHIVPIAESDWLDINEMDAYMRGNEPMHLDPSNLMAMKCDLHLAQFDRGTFAIVPKCGELRVHFLKNVDNAGNYYHNTLFTNDYVSLQLLFARFAMQIIKFNKSGDARGGELSGHGDSGSNEIDGGGGVGRGKGGGGGGSGGDGGSGGAGAGTSRGDGVDGSRSKHLETRAQKKRREAGKMKEDSGKAEDSGMEKKRRKVAKKTKDNDNEDEMEIEDKLDADAERERDCKELAYDMDLASRTVSFFVDENQPIDQWSYDHLTGYPGAASVRRLKEKYLRQNPQVRAHSSAAVEAVLDNGESLKEFDSD